MRYTETLLAISHLIERKDVRRRDLRPHLRRLRRFTHCKLQVQIISNHIKLFAERARRYSQIIADHLSCWHLQACVLAGV